MASEVGGLMVFKLGTRVFKYSILIFFVITSFMTVAAEETKVDVVPSHIKGALCYIKADNQVVFVDEVFTKKKLASWWYDWRK